MGCKWIEAPPFTTELGYAESLLPEGLFDLLPGCPSSVCATALQAAGSSPMSRPPMASTLSRGEEASSWLWRCDGTLQGQQHPPHAGRLGSRITTARTAENAGHGNDTGWSFGLQLLMRHHTPPSNKKRG